MMSSPLLCSISSSSLLQSLLSRPAQAASPTPLLRHCYTPLAALRTPQLQPERRSIHLSRRISSVIAQSRSPPATRSRKGLSTMSGKKLITVFGATGAQGGSVVDVFLNDPKLKSDWRVRGITRDATKDSSKKLAERGAEVVAVRVSPPLPIIPLSVVLRSTALIPCAGRCRRP